MSAPIEEIEAGDYELVAEVFDQPTNAEGKPFTFRRYRKGDIVTLDVAEARRLYKAGAVVLPGEREEAAAALAFAQYQAALAALPEAVRARVFAEQGASVEETEDDPSEPPADPPSEQPKRTAPKGEWVAFSVAHGADQAEAEAASKDELIAQYGS